MSDMMHSIDKAADKSKAKELSAEELKKTVGGARITPKPGDTPVIGPDIPNK